MWLWMGEGLRLVPWCRHQTRLCGTQLIPHGCWLPRWQHIREYEFPARIGAAPGSETERQFREGGGGGGGTHHDQRAALRRRQPAAVLLHHHNPR